MIFETITLNEVQLAFGHLKPDLIDKFAEYIGLKINDELVGIVSFQVHPTHIYLCHAYVKEEYRRNGYYNMLWEYRNTYINQHHHGLEIVAHCNVSSLKQFLNKGYELEKPLFKVIKRC